MTINLLINKVYFTYQNIKLKSENVAITEEKEIIKVSNSKEKKSEGTKEEYINNIWKIEIPKINLKAPISEGTSQEIMLNYVGHFENTSIWNGNIGLAAHNRGYPINYFAKLKELKIGDLIIYRTNNGTKKYKIKLIKIIEDTDWSYLGTTKENKITLITCVENKPTKRLCVQGLEIKEE